MATYLYQVCCGAGDAPSVTFEVRQSMRDAPLTHHPTSGQPVRRVLTGGYGLMKVRASATTMPMQTGHPAGTCCPGCHE